MKAYSPMQKQCFAFHRPFLVCLELATRDKFETSLGKENYRINKMKEISQQINRKSKRH